MQQGVRQMPCEGQLGTHAAGGQSNEARLWTATDAALWAELERRATRSRFYSATVHDRGMTPCIRPRPGPGQVPRTAESLQRQTAREAMGSTRGGFGARRGRECHTHVSNKFAGSSRHARAMNQISHRSQHVMASEPTDEEKAEKRRKAVEVMTEKARKVQINWEGLPEEEKNEKHEKALKAMTAFTNRYLKLTGTRICEDPSIAATVLNGLAMNKNELGSPLCPCRFYEDKAVEVADGYWNCPCEPMRKEGHCHCMLFLQPDHDMAGEDNIDWNYVSGYDM